MAANVDNTSDDDSFIILRTSPGSSLDNMKNALPNGDVQLDKSYLEDALKELSDEANMAFKAHFKLGDCPSPASMMVASTMVTDHSSTEDLQKRFGEILDENVILKETLKQNNDSMKEQFLLIASCQEDMMKTQMLHKEKFEETRDLVEKLRHENRKLKCDLLHKSEAEVQTSDSLDSKSGPSSGLEFVTSPDDDTINKLTAQLELVERQRRQVLVENEKLTWQKESLEHIVDATSKERDELKEKIHNLELQLSSKDNDYSAQISRLKVTIQDQQSKLRSASTSSSVPTEELVKRDTIIQQLDGKVSSLQAELKNSQLKILELENVKLEFTKHRSGLSETVRIYKEQIQELHNRLKEAQTTMFQPVRLSFSAEREASPSAPSSLSSSSSPSSSEYGGLMSNVKLYDRTLKHLAELLNSLTNGLSDRLVEALGVASSLLDYKLERSSAEQFKACLADLRQQLAEQHSAALNYVVQVKSSLSIFEQIFKDHNELLKKNLTKQEIKPANPNVEALTSALLARGQELHAMDAELQRLRLRHDDCDLLKAQLDLYKSDFEAERESREKMACQKENAEADFRVAQKRLKELTAQLDAVRKLDANVYRSATSQGNAPAPGPARGATRPASGPAKIPGAKKKKKMSEEDCVEEGRPESPPPPRFVCPVCDEAFKALVQLQQHVYTCPKCMRFKTSIYPAMQEHVNYCLELDNDPCSPM